MRPTQARAFIPRLVGPALPPCPGNINFCTVAPAPIAGLRWLITSSLASGYRALPSGSERAWGYAGWAGGDLLKGDVREKPGRWTDRSVGRPTRRGNFSLLMAGSIFFVLSVGERFPQCDPDSKVFSALEAPAKYPNDCHYTCPLVLLGCPIRSSVWKGLGFLSDTYSSTPQGVRLNVITVTYIPQVCFELPLKCDARCHCKLDLSSTAFFLILILDS